VPSASECVGRRRHCRCDRRTHSDTERTCRTGRSGRLNSHRLTRHRQHCLVVSGAQCEFGIMLMAMLIELFEYIVEYSIRSRIIARSPLPTGERNIVLNVPACMSVRKHNSGTTRITTNLCACNRLSWLGPSPAAFRYVLYFWFCG